MTLLDELQRVLGAAQPPVRVRERRRRDAVEQALLGKRRESVEGVARADVGLASTPEQLQGLHDELHIPDPARIEVREVDQDPVLLAGFDRPFTLLVMSAALNGFVMFLYSGLLLWLNCTSFRGIMRPHPVRIAALLGSLLFFGYFSVLTLLDQIARLGSG